MAARGNADTWGVITYRGAQRLLVYLLAIAMLAAVFAAFADIEHHVEGASEWIAVIVLTVAGAGVPLALLLWSASIGIRLSDAGIVSIGFDSADAIRWSELRRFFLDDRGPNRIAVYAGLGDGSRVVLTPLQGWRWERAWLGRACDELSERLSYEHAREPEQGATTESFGAIRFGRPVRVHEGGTRVRAAA
ncbi:MAG TPA: hypothetical protein VGG41_06505 [Solirubrobacteraceae bacterium]|jgi:hypothetical protein